MYTCYILVTDCRYGLLGPSGCGKTTLLRSVLGRLQLDSGHLLVLGDRPGAKGHKVPGNMVGYMPQVLSCFTLLFSLFHCCFLFLTVNDIVGSNQN